MLAAWWHPGSAKVCARPVRASQTTSGGIDVRVGLQMRSGDTSATREPDAARTATGYGIRSTAPSGRRETTSR